MFIGLLSFCAQVSFSGLLRPKEPLKCLTLNTGPFRTTIIDPHVRVSLPSKVKNMNVEVFANDCKCLLNESVCNPKQKWNHNEYRCECKEVDD